MCSSQGRAVVVAQRVRRLTDALHDGVDGGNLCVVILEQLRQCRPYQQRHIRLQDVDRHPSRTVAEMHKVAADGGPTFVELSSAVGPHSGCGRQHAGGLLVAQVRILFVLHAATLLRWLMMGKRLCCVLQRLVSKSLAQSVGGARSSELLRGVWEHWEGAKAGETETEADANGPSHTLSAPHAQLSPHLTCARSALSAMHTI